MVGCALGGIVVAGLARLGVEVGARHRSADAQEALMLAVARVTDVAVIAPVESELERYEQARQAVATANVKVAPNSPKARANDRAVPEASAGAAMGSVTVNSVRLGLAPR